MLSATAPLKIIHVLILNLFSALDILKNRTIIIFKIKIKEGLYGTSKRTSEKLQNIIEHFH